MINKSVVLSNVLSKFQVLFGAVLLLEVMCVQGVLFPASAYANAQRPVVIVSIDGPIGVATDDYLKTSMQKAVELNAQLFVVELNTPGGLLPSMQSMVETLLESPIPTVVYVSPSGGGAISAGVFITMAGHFAVMAPGTTIGAAHPVSGNGGDVKGDMRAKIENFAVSHIKAIAEQRGRNAEWAEKAVRESVAITDREALDNKVIDFIASDLDKLLAIIEGETVSANGNPVTLTQISSAPRTRIDMSLKQNVLEVLGNPEVTILLGLVALLGIGIELYHPGGIVPGIVGVICLVLSLTSAQVLPINYGGASLLLLSVAFFAIEVFTPSFGLFGGSGIVCLVLGSIYIIDTNKVWGLEGFGIDPWLIGSVAATVGVILLSASYMVLQASRRSFSTGIAGMLEQTGVVTVAFENEQSEDMICGKVRVMGELWKARADSSFLGVLSKGQKVKVVEVNGLELTVSPLDHD